MKTQKTSRPSQTQIARDPIKAALMLCEKPVLDDPETGIKLEKMGGAINRLTAHSAQLFGIEKNASKTLSTRRADLERQKNQLSNIQRFGNDYTIFNPEALRWRDKEGRPRLALFSISSPELKFTAKTSRDYDSYSGWYSKRKFTASSSIPKKICPYYRDVLDDLTKLAKERKKKVCLSAEFSGLIPMKVKEIIVEARKQFKNNIFILAQVKKWRLEKGDTSELVQNSGLLVVGYDEPNDCFWLIATFDLKPLDEFVRSEFDVK